MTKTSLGILIASLFLSGCSLLPQSTTTPPTEPTSAPTSQVSPQVSAKPTADTSKFLPFTNKQLSFSYPPEVKVSEDQGKVNLHHSIVHKHPDHCDFQGSGKTLDELADFNMTFQIIEADLKGTLEKRSETYLADQLQGNGFVIEKGFIDSAEVGKYKGFQVLSGVEGCGNLVYYVPISAQKTLVIERALVPELAPINADFEANRKLPGIIHPDQEAVWVESVLKSVKVL